MLQSVLNPALKNLAGLVGEWTAEICHPLDPTTIIRGRATFAWLEGGAFLLQHSEVPRTGFPRGTMTIGRDESVETYCMLYFDSRGVSRIYQMSLSDGVWKLWRDAPGFSQRFTGTFTDDGRTIAGQWEKSSDGQSWEHDFDLTYRKVE